MVLRNNFCNLKFNLSPLNPPIYGGMIFGKVFTKSAFGYIIFIIMNMIDDRKQSVEIQQEEQLFKVLSHPARLAILDELRHDEACVCHLEAKLGYRQAYLSQQLSVLRDAGMIADRKDGWNVYYHVTDLQIYEVLNAARQLLGKTENEETHNKTVCTCPKCSGNDNRC